MGGGAYVTDVRSYDGDFVFLLSLFICLKEAGIFEIVKRWP